MLGCKSTFDTFFHPFDTFTFQLVIFGCSIGCGSFRVLIRRLLVILLLLKFRVACPEVYCCGFAVIVVAAVVVVVLVLIT